jgi:ubiquinone/menaquinone biosynthesis C-methylase UbiE
MIKKKFDYEEIDVGFYDNIYHRSYGVRSAWHHIKFNFIKKKIDEKNHHLDIGCGSGTFISLLQNNFSVGIDISEKQINFANKKYGAETKQFFHYKNKIPFQYNSFDSISIVELIEHLSDNEISNLFDETYKVLKKGGKIYITTPNYLSLWPVLEFFLNKISKVSYEHQHINKFNFLNINKIIDEKKYKITQKNSFIYLSPFTAFFSFKFSIFFSKLENIFFKFFPGFLLFIEIEKK